MSPQSQGRSRRHRLMTAAIAVAALIASPSIREVRAADPPAAVDFGREVLPILSDKCFLCHGPDAEGRKADLRLDVKEGALREDDPVIVPGRSGESELIRRLTSEDENEVMPPRKSGRKITPEQIDSLKRWIDQGATWGKHWAFEAPRRREPPTRRDGAWPRNGTDRFVLARLEAEGLRPSPEAEKTALIRRASLDLTGLPPSPEEVDAFLADPSPDAYEKLVDRLLASPHYGERMAWDWLDAARYADSNGYQGDADRTMWPWRDWAVAALNRNLPFDQFTIEQLAGDLLPNATHDQKLATAFNRNHMINGEGGRIPEENRVDYVMDMAETAGTVWLGLTFNCCRCHDHKFDALSQRDYYGLFAFFNQTPVTGGDGSPQAAPAIEAPTPEQAAGRDARNAAVREAASHVEEMERTSPPRAEAPSPEVAKLLAIPPAARNHDQVASLEKQVAAGSPVHAALLKKHREAVESRDAFARSIARVMVMEDLSKPRETFVLNRGSYQEPRGRVVADVPASLAPLPADAPRNRLALARWLVSPENPLTARVAVNRAWQTFFGVGLVKTPEDFGVQGERPSHPELLDWLATEFVRSGWDVKALHRLIATSATYRQSSRVPAGMAERDPQNRLLGRGARFRMPSWMIRDQALAASGLLVRKIGGPPVKPYQPDGVWEEATFGNKRYQADSGESLYRRSLYTFWRRIVGPTEFFDSAPRQTCAVKPVRTNTPLHALTTLNDVTYVEAARVMAERVLSPADLSPEARVERAFRLVLSRKPTMEERPVLLASLERLRREFARDPASVEKWLGLGASKRDARIDAVEHASYAALCLAILNLDEALTKE